MKITLIGCGAIGKLWLAALSSQGHDVQGWLRVAQSDLFVDVNGPDDKIFRELIPCNNHQHLHTSELVIVCLKAWQVSDALLPLLPIIPETSPILLLHNGLGTLEELGTLRHPFLSGVTTHAAWQDNNQVFHIASGITHIGAVNSQAEAYYPIANILHEALPDVAWHNQILNTIWRKLVVNCVINPLSTEHNCTNGQIIHYPEQIVRVIDECCQVMVAEGLHTDKEEMTERVYDIIHQTSENYSSMLQDVRHHRRTEIDYITGFLIKKARAHGLATPENDRLYHLIKNREQSYDNLRADMHRQW
ncbi:2-dehydropantoate 2-reductase [Providencia sp. PROV188]|jgi:2-dehydropantoate 2-reductase|uniref:2-dehydropantoate 2-reductase n=1 Tax=Providencia alcalifaciens TaxID=126385 RepID=A0A4R3NKZ0_9GAMM|nr:MULTISPECIES: 2-dehydropantoate 2-reductase [Providencia]ETS99371.1 2-dehydropantoate 2-reductase [Providencia alcalifaciens PAL-3]EUC99740.1 2-dehydropantoate 2-reductase [Providencia alcalifaciens PAL-1]MBC5789409.1 2-dehydropantoate 2-reductase [Providencia sp. JUb39]MBG5884177.1 2-dehydropantoate 2-reductase [Providencia alcalifaciens]MBS0924506.1 2-dehydropantoate 2-reductase [Providencia sp. JGM181]